MRLRLRLEPSREVVELEALDPLDRALLAPPFGHAAVEEAAEAANPDRQSKLRGAARVPVVAADQDDLLIAIGQPREASAEAGLDGGDGDRARDVGVVELEVGPHVDQQRALRALVLDLARGERHDLDPLGQQARPG